MTNKKYRVVFRQRAGMVGVDTELSQHSSRPSAFKALHKYAKEYNESNLFVVDIESGLDQLEIKRKDSKGRWRTI